MKNKLEKLEQYIENVIKPNFPVISQKIKVHDIKKNIASYDIRGKQVHYNKYSSICKWTIIFYKPITRFDIFNF